MGALTFPTLSGELSEFASSLVLEPCACRHCCETDVIYHRRECHFNCSKVPGAFDESLPAPLSRWPCNGAHTGALIAHGAVEGAIGY